MTSNIGLVRRGILALAFAALTGSAFAYWTPLQLNLAGAAGLPPAADSVYGLRANILLGDCDSVWLFDVGVCNITRIGDYGIRAGAFNWGYGEAYGLSVGVLNNDEYNAGLTAGVFNYAKRGAGVQIGLVNIADEYTGLQIGVLNFHFKSVIPLFPLFNMGSGD